MVATVTVGGSVAYADDNGHGSDGGQGGNTGHMPDSHPRGYSLVFHDEFDGHALARSKWCTRYIWENGAPLQVPDSACTATFADSGDTVFGVGETLPGNGEKEVYRDINSVGEPLHVVQNGYLALTATKTGSGDLPYESALIRSKAEYLPTPGHPLFITARIRQPWALGSWPAFWLNEGFGGQTAERPVWPPEIDILEGPLNYDGQFPNQYHVGLADWTPDGPGPQGPITWTYYTGWENNIGFDPTWKDLHVTKSLRNTWLEVSLEWFTDHACFYFEGTKFACATYNWVHQDGTAGLPAVVQLNLAIGGPWAGSNGIEDWAFPYSFDVDYVRIYRR